MASPQEDALVTTEGQQPPSREETSGSAAAVMEPPPRRHGKGGEPADGVGVKCAAMCFRLPSRSRSKKAHPPVKLVPCGSTREDAQQRVTFLASASLSTWWPSSPSAGASNSFVVERRASGGARSVGGGGGRRTLSSSFSHWRRSMSSSRVTPHGAAAATVPARASFSFPSSPVSVSSCMSTPRIAHGCPE